MRDTTLMDSLKERVKLNSTIIGVGNAGNQFVNAAFNEGYTSVFAVNTSESDLSDTNLDRSIPAFLIGDEARGAGQNREKAKDLFQYNGKQLFSVPKFQENIQLADIVYVTGSTDGGTGSGIAPEIVRLLTTLYPNKIIIYIGSLPKISTPAANAHKNMIECLNEVNMLKVPYMLADLSYYEDMDNHIAYKQIAKHIVTSIGIIAGRYLNTTSGDSIDENDMRTIVSEPGYLATYMLDKVTSAQVEKETIQSMMIKLINHSPVVNIQKDRIIKQIGVINNSPSDLREISKTGNYSELTEFIGIPRGIFKNEAIVQSNVGQFMTILSGMSLPYNRILQASAIIEQNEEALRRKKTIDLSSEVSKLDFLNDSDTKSKLVNSTKYSPVNLESTLDNFFSKK